VDILFKIAGLAIAGLSLTVMVRRHSPELGMLLGLLVTVAVLTAGLDAFRTLRDFIDMIMAESGINGELAAPLWKAGIIAVVTKITAELCRDANEKAAASGVETAGAVLGLLVVLPLFSSFFDLIRGLL
jgi:stage III sporulation protein AD